MTEGQAIEAHTESSPNAPNIGQVTAIQRPDYVPEKFYDAKTGVINFEAMSKSYTELEKKSSAAPKPDETPTPDKPNEPVKEEVKEPLVLPAVPGVTPEAMKGFSAELNTKGELSPESYASLKTLGYDKAMVDTYVKGLTSDSAVQQSVQAARVADSQIAEITTAIGGKAALTEMQKWATGGGMTDAQLAAYNAAVSSPNVETVRLAVNGLKNSFVSANGTGEDNLLSGNGNVTDLGEVFHSRAEQTVAINDPRYAKDPAYRAVVSAKIGRSKI